MIFSFDNIKIWSSLSKNGQNSDLRRNSSHMWPFIVIGVVVVLLLGGVISMLAYTTPIAEKVYREYLVNPHPENRTRECSCVTNEEQVAMWNAGCEWAEARTDKMREVEVHRDGLRFLGEYYDFGHDRCVIILPGRCECLKYSYFYSKPYEDAGFNVLVIDQRSYGLSDGEFNTIGKEECEDLKVWIKFVEEELGIHKIWLHSICVGSSTAVLLTSSAECPESIKALVTDGCFISFRESFRTHMEDLNRPTFPVLGMVMRNIKKYTGTDVDAIAPIKLIDKVKIPVLFLYGEKDIFSKPEKSKLLIEKCGSTEKEVEWFKEGAHSHLRYTNPEQYDAAILRFSKKSVFAE